MIKQILISLFFVALSVDLIGQTLTGTVDRNQLSANQTLTLTLTYDDSTRSDALDLSAVTQDFEILSSTSGTSYQIINTERSRATTWTLVLAPRRTGNLIIPSFNLGNIYSEAIQVQVLEADQVADRDDPMTVELSVDRNQARMGEQVLVRVKLRAQSNLANLAGEELKIEGVDIQLADRQDYAEIQNGVNWQVIEWTYAVFPQSAGAIAIPRQMFTATVPSSQRRGFFDSFSLRGERIAARSEAAVVNVESADNSQGDWFPASDVKITSGWTSDPSNLRVGEPLTRIVEITAQSQVAAAIPPLSAQSPDTYKEYRDQPALDNTLSKNGVSGTRRESSAIVPSETGLIEFPEQIIRWWDINTNQWREALLPAEAYEVLPAINNEQSFSPPENFEVTPALDFENNQLPGLSSSPSVASNPFWKWATIALLLVTAIQTVLLLRTRSAAPSREHLTSGQHRSESENQAWKDLSAALNSENAADIRRCLIKWSNARWPQENFHTLDTLAEKSSSAEFRKALAGLDLILFKGAVGKPSTSSLRTELEVLRAAVSKKASESPLAPLYPQTL